MIEFRDCNIGYPNHIIFENLNLTIQEGVITTILGPNGSGKTTLLSAVLDKSTLRSGDIFIGKTKLRAMNIKQLSTTISVVPQFQPIVFDFLVKDVALMGRNPHMHLSPTKVDIELVNWTFKRLGISFLLEQSYGKISGGERQMVNIARAVIQNTPIIIMDEPTSYLDLKNQAKVMNLIRLLNEEDKKTIIMTLHDPAQAKAFSDDVLFVDNGKVIQGRSCELIHPDMIESIYQVSSKMVQIDGQDILVPLLHEPLH